MVWLARLVEQSETAMIGTAILLLPLYPPALVAKQIADLDRRSGRGLDRHGAPCSTTSAGIPDFSSYAGSPTMRTVCLSNRDGSSSSVLIGVTDVAVPFVYFQF